MNTEMQSQPFKRANFLPEAILELSTTLKAKPWRLLQSEILQILNHVPMSAQEIRFLLEDADLRFKEEELDEMLIIIQKTMKVENATIGGAGPQ
jgi:DNA-directed RNA polymerase subunit F